MRAGGKEGINVDLTAFCGQLEIKIYSSFGEKTADKTRVSCSVEDVKTEGRELPAPRQTQLFGFALLLNSFQDGQILLVQKLRIFYRFYRIAHAKVHQTKIEK